MRKVVSMLAPASSPALKTVYLVGAGPGAPDLLTVRALRLLERASIVFYDALVTPEILACATQAQHVSVGKRCADSASVMQSAINQQLITATEKHDVVIRLKGGDPMIFGRAQEEIEALTEAGIHVEVVPGITAALAASAQLKTALTQRGIARSVAFITPRVGRQESPSNWTSLAMHIDTVAIYMGAAESNQLVQDLLAQGLPENHPIVIAENISQPHAQYIHGQLIDLPTLALQHLSGGASLILLGPVFKK